MTHIYVVEFTGPDVPTPPTTPDLSKFEIIVAETHFCIIQGNHSEIENELRNFPYWRNAGHPKAGQWIGAGGDETFIDANGNIVETAFDVVKTLDVDMDEYTEESAEDILEQMSLVF